MDKLDSRIVVSLSVVKPSDITRCTSIRIKGGLLVLEKVDIGICVDLFTLKLGSFLVANGTSVAAVVRVVDACAVSVEAFQLTLPSCLTTEGVNVHTVVSIIENVSGSTQDVRVALTPRS